MKLAQEAVRKLQPTLAQIHALILADMDRTLESLRWRGKKR